VKFISIFPLLVALIPLSAIGAEEIHLQKNQEAKARDISDAIPRRETDLIDGLILNRAMTRFGHRFYREFVAAYRDIGGETVHSGLTIEEKATARSGSIITIFNNRKRIFVTVVSPASRNIDKQALSAATRIDQILKQNKKQASWAQFLNPDLAADEF